MNKFILLLKTLPLVLLAACATFRGMGEDLGNLGKGIDTTMSEYERKSSSAPSSSHRESGSDNRAQMAEIRRAQNRLRSAGFDPGPVDGILGTKTQTAIRDYQAANGLPTTGVLDQKTQKALGIQ